MIEKSEPVFASVEESTTFKKELNKYLVAGLGFADLNAHLVDTCIINDYPAGSAIKYLALKLGWIFSKLLRKGIAITGSSILLVPAEENKDRSIGLYKPVLPYLNNKSYDLINVHKVFNSIAPGPFLKWLMKLPRIVSDANRATKSAGFQKLMPQFRWNFIIDTAVHYLWVLQLRRFFQRSSYRSVLIDWDRHKFQSLIALAARSAGVESYTFVHGAIFTQEKFVPLIAGKCFTWGNDHLRFFTGLGEKADSLIKVGNPRFSNALPSRESVSEKYQIPVDKKIILHPSQNWAGEEDYSIIKSLHDFIAPNGHFRLAVKFHPSQYNEALIKRLKETPEIIVLDPAITSFESLALADCAIIVSSTFSIDALIARVPVAVYLPHPKLRGIAIDLVNNAKAPLLKDENDFNIFLQALETMPVEEVIDTKAQQAFIKNYCEYYGAESAERIAAIL